WEEAPLTPDPSPSRGEGGDRADEPPAPLLPLGEMVDRAEGPRRMRGAGHNADPVAPCGREETENRNTAASHPSRPGVKLYPAPRTVLSSVGFLGSASIFFRSRATWLSMLRSSGVQSWPLSRSMIW